MKLNDVVGYKNLKIYQDKCTFSFCLDSILLANFVKINLKDKKVLDLGTGNGIIPIILSRRTDALITGIEIQKKLSDMASKSVLYNELENRISIINMDINDFYLDVLPSTYDVITCNPPYFKVTDSNKKNIIEEKLIARHETNMSLTDVYRISKKLLKDGGRLAIINKVDRLAEIFELSKLNNIAIKRIKFVYDRINSPSSLVLVEGIKNGKDGITVEKPFILHDLNGIKTDQYINLLEEVNYESKEL